MATMILNIAAYHFHAIEDPPRLAAHVRALAATAQARGTVLVAPEGINLFLAGGEPALRGFVAQIRRDTRFADLVVKESRSDAVPFARLKVKVKPEIITFRRGASPLHGRAPVVAAHTLARWLDQGRDDDGRPLVLLDTRNEEEVGHGTFTGALTLPITDFTQLPDAVAARRDGLHGRTVVSFCTGGVRCEKAALWMREAGIDHVLQLDGGILGYFEQVGGRHYDGRCFVFDRRVAVDPQLRPLADGP